MRRRTVLRLFGGVAASWPLPLFAQTARPARIGVLGPSPSNPIIWPAYQAFLQEMGKFGYHEGQNLTVELRPVHEDFSVLLGAAKELVALKVDVLAALGTEVALKAALAATESIPVVFVANNYDPIELGYVKSLAKPGANATGIFLRQTELAEKQVELLTEAVPDRKRLAILWDAISADQFAAAEKRARLLGLQIHSLKLEHPPYDFDAAYRTVTGGNANMLLVLSSPFFGLQAKRVIDLANQHRLPSMYIFKSYALNGGLMSYGADSRAMYRQSANFIAKILNGAKPMDLPVELPTRYEFAVNLKTAKLIGVELPTSILLRANDVIE